MSELKYDYRENFPFTLHFASETSTTAKTPAIRRNNYKDCTIEFILEGAGTLEINGKTFHIARNGIYFLTPGSNHRYWPDKKNPWTKLFFEVDGDFMKYILHVYALEEIYCIPNCYELKKHFEAMRKIYHNSPLANQQAALIFHQFAVDAAKIVYGGETQLPPDMEKLKSTLDHAVEKNFRLADYAKNNNVSDAHLIRSFRKVFNMTPYEYLMDKKMENAKNLLQYSHLSVKEIADHLAFSDQYYFSNYFKQKTGLAPSEYRKKTGLYSNTSDHIQHQGNETGTK
jgi:AraC-like DNA-binding protein